MKRYKVKEILKLLSEDGWILKNQRGSHRQFIHPTKPGKVTVNNKLGDTLDQDVLNKYFQQAKWR